jgi:hypothetical protein
LKCLPEVLGVPAMVFGFPAARNFTVLLPEALIYCVFCGFGPFLDPYFLGVFKGEFCIFFGLFKKLHLRDFKTL